VVTKAIVDMVLKRKKNKKIKNEARIEHGLPVWQASTLPTQLSQTA
jgi:hypothetical protein